jgi:hypothetical protein
VWRLFLHNGSNGFNPSRVYDPETTNINGVVVGDFNSDGRGDLMFSRYGNDPTHLWLYSADAAGETHESSNPEHIRCPREAPSQPTWTTTGATT